MMTNDDLRAWQTRHRYTGSALARALDVHPSTVQRWRDGTLPVPTVVTLALEALAARP